MFPHVCGVFFFFFFYRGWKFGSRARVLIAYSDCAAGSPLALVMNKLTVFFSFGSTPITLFFFFSSPGEGARFCVVATYMYACTSYRQKNILHVITLSLTPTSDGLAQCVSFTGEHSVFARCTTLYRLQDRATPTTTSRVTLWGCIFCGWHGAFGVPEFCVGVRQVSPRVNWGLVNYFWYPPVWCV